MPHPPHHGNPSGFGDTTVPMGFPLNEAPEREVVILDPPIEDSDLETAQWGEPPTLVECLAILAGEADWKLLLGLAIAALVVVWLVGRTFGWV